jgi:hypothetical protein
MSNKDLVEKYNIIYIISNIFYVTTLTFYLVLEDEIFNRYYVMILFIPVYINYFLTYHKQEINLSLVINFIYIITKLTYMISYFNYKYDYEDIDKLSYILYSLFLYLVFIVEVINILHFYFAMLVTRKNYISYDNVESLNMN